MAINPFEFHTVPSIEMVWGGAKRLGEIATNHFDARNALIVTDAGLTKTGLIEPIKLSLEKAGFSVVIFDKVVADPPEAIVLDCVDQARKAGVDIVLGIGGGSSLDVAKLVSVLLVANQPLSSMYGIGKVKGHAYLCFLCQQQPVQVQKLPISRLLPRVKQQKWAWCP